MTDSEKKKLKKYKLTGLNKPKRTPNHPTKKAIVAVRTKSGNVKIIRFGAQEIFWAGKGGSKKNPPKSQKHVKGMRRRRA